VLGKELFNFYKTKPPVWQVVFGLLLVLAIGFGFVIKDTFHRLSFVRIISNFKKL
jgi:hypothetical protein